MSWALRAEEKGHKPATPRCQVVIGEKTLSSIMTARCGRLLREITSICKVFVPLESLRKKPRTLWAIKDMSVVSPLTFFTKGKGSRGSGECRFGHTWGEMQVLPLSGSRAKLSSLYFLMYEMEV